MSKYFNLVKFNYDNGYWSEERVRNAVTAVPTPWITEEEFELIVGKPYTE